MHSFFLINPRYANLSSIFNFTGIFDSPLANALVKQRELPQFFCYLIPNCFYFPALLISAVSLITLKYPAQYCHQSFFGREFVPFMFLALTYWNRWRMWAVMVFEDWGSFDAWQCKSQELMIVKLDHYSKVSFHEFLLALSKNSFLT